MQSIIVSGRATSYPITRMVGENILTTFQVEVASPRNPETPNLYVIECWNDLGLDITQIIMPSDFITITARDLQIDTYINKAGDLDVRLKLLAIDVDCSQIERSDADYVGLFG